MNHFCLQWISNLYILPYTLLSRVFCLGFYSLNRVNGTETKHFLSRDQIDWSARKKALHLSQSFDKFLLMYDVDVSVAIVKTQCVSSLTILIADIMYVTKSSI